MHIQNLWVLTLIPFAAAALLLSIRRDRPPAVRFSTGSLLDGLGSTFRIRLYQALVFLRVIIVVLMLVALSRPQSVIEESRVETEGIDIVLAIDTSTSMLAEDFKLRGQRKNRLDVVKDVVTEFIRNRDSDRIGIVAFASEAYSVAPLTLDYGWLVSNLERVKTGMIEDGTAIGSGIGSSLNRLRDTAAKGKVVILLTDGRNNAGKISPLTAAEAAEALNIRIYTIGAGTKGLAPYPAKDFFGNTVYRQVKIEIDEQSLKGIAEKTSARYFRATDTESLRDIYDEIDRLEKTPIEEKGYTEYRELFHYFLIPGFFLFLLEVVLRNSYLRRIP